MLKQCKELSKIHSFCLVTLCCLFICAGQKLHAADFHKLIIDGQLDAVRRDLARDDVLYNMSDELGRSPLHLAVISGHLAIVNVLINAGADVNAVERLKKFTPLHYAAFYSFPKIMLFLLSRRADVFMSDCEGNLPLHFAAANGCPATVQILLQHDATPDCMNTDWQTPLHLAAKATDNRKEFPAASGREEDYLEVTRLLLEAGATTGLYDIWRNMPETIAWQKDHRSTFPKRFSQLLKTFAHTR